MESELYQPHLQCLHDFLGRSLAGWTCENVNTLTLVFKKPIFNHEQGVTREVNQFVFSGVGQTEFLFVASLDKLILREIFLSSNLTWSQTEDKLIWENYGLVDPDRVSGVILGRFNHEKAFEDPELYSPKRRLLLRVEDYKRLVAQDPLCFLSALGMPRQYKPPPT